MALQDTWVIRRILSGDREAFGDLVGRYSGLVHGVILNKVRRPDEVEDLVQDVFCKAFEELPKLRDPNRFAPWLARIAQNRAQQWLRQRQTHTSYVPAVEEHLSTYVGDERPDRLLETSDQRTFYGKPWTGSGRNSDRLSCSTTSRTVASTTWRVFSTYLCRPSSGV